MFSKSTAKFGRLRTDDGEYGSEGFHVVTAGSKKRDNSNIAKAFDKDNFNAKDYSKRKRIEEKCVKCLDKCPKHLQLANSDNVYLSLPKYESLISGHCLIRSCDHVTSTHDLHDGAKDLVQFQEQLAKMFLEKMNSAMVCVEMVTNEDVRLQKHMELEVFPVSLEYKGSLRPMFKKSILDAQYEWAQNKKMLNIRSSNRSISSYIPKEFAFFKVEFFNLDSADDVVGFAATIESDESFPPYFARENIACLLEDIEPSLWRKPKEESFNLVAKKVLAFERMWGQFNLWDNDDDSD